MRYLLVSIRYIPFDHFHCQWMRCVFDFNRGLALLAFKWYLEHVEKKSV